MYEIFYFLVSIYKIFTFAILFWDGLIVFSIFNRLEYFPVGFGKVCSSSAYFIHVVFGSCDYFLQIKYHASEGVASVYRVKRLIVRFPLLHSPKTSNWKMKNRIIACRHNIAQPMILLFFINWIIKLICLLSCSVHSITYIPLY